MKKILIIDDDEVFTKTLTDFLTKDNKYEVIHAKDGIDGLAMVEPEHPNIIILDLLMPKMGGMEFLDQLRKKNLPKQIPILISSQLSKIEDISKAIVAGMDIGVKGYVIKASENLDMITNEIEKTLEKYSDKV